MLNLRVVLVVGCVGTLAACGSAESAEPDMSHADIANIKNLRSDFPAPFQVTDIAPTAIDPRVLAACDPLIGHFSDRAGRRPLMVAASIPLLAIGMIGLFHPPADAALAAPWLAAMVVVTYLGFSLGSIAYQAWGAALTQDRRPGTNVRWNDQGEYYLFVIAVSPCARPTMESLLKDVRHALRMFRENSAFAAVAVLVLGVGIGGVHGDRPAQRPAGVALQERLQ